MIDEQKKLAIWDKTSSVPDKDPTMFKLDACGALIEWNKYGDNEKY